MASVLQTCLLLGVFVPLASFAFLALAGTKLGGSRRQPPSEPDPGHEHDHPTGPARGEPAAGYVATAAIAFSLVMALICLVIWLKHPESHDAFTQAARDAAVVWTVIGNVAIQFGVKLDALTVIMFLMVSLCATCIHVFSIGYMKGDPRFARFFTYMSLFCFSMLGLVISSNLVFLFIFWELVGVCSYFLIGFWFEKKSASDAAIKAFVVNRVGDFGFMIGLALCFIYLGDMSLDGAAAIFEAAAHAAGKAHGPLSAAAAAVAPESVSRASALFTTTLWGVPVATWLGICLFCGAIGKSAQFPLHVWLPDAMEGPTPVSALIHAATMVAAGVYLVGRVFLLLTPGAQFFIAVIGCITLTMAALIAIVQLDIKRVLAYSTLSQLGYMIFAMGIGAWIAALFHLLIHAFFKALLFLGSGQVIIGCHHEQDMRRMGGLWSKMPNTAFTFLIAVLAISGAGIPWTKLGLGGFYSKDEILAVAHYRHFGWEATPGDHEPHARTPAELSVVPVGFEPGVAQHGLAPGEQGHVAPAAAPAGSHEEAAHHEPAYAAAYPEVTRLPFILFLLPVLIAYVTPFYMGRCFVLTFLSPPRDRHVHEHAHESRIMYGPLLVLAAMTAVSGWMLFRGLVAEAVPQGGAPTLVPAIDGSTLHSAHHALPLWVGFSWMVGLLAAYLLYRNGFGVAERVRRLPALSAAYAVLWNKFYFDHVYNFLLVGGTKVVAVICRLFDNWIVDGMVNGSALATERISRFSGVVLDNMGVDGAVNLVGKTGWGLGGLLRSVHTGIVRNYILLAVIAISGLVIYILSAGNLIWTLIWVALAALALLVPRARLRGPQAYGR